MRLRAILVLLLFLFHAVAQYVRTMLFPSLDSYIRYLTIAGDGVVVLAALTVLWKRRSFYGTAAFLGFLVFATLTYIANSSRLELLAHLNGLRQPAFFLASLILMYDVIDGDSRGVFAKVGIACLVVFAVLQIPTSVHQFIVFGPGDAVGGTYGSGGGSGYLTQLVFLVTFFLCVVFASRPDGAGFIVWRVIAASVLLVPSALNETKITFLYLPLFIVLIGVSMRRFYAAIPLLGLGAVLGYFLYTYYSENVVAVEKVWNVKFLEQYLVYDSRTNIDVPRFQKLILMWNRMGDDVGALVFGYGYGLFGGKNILGTSGYMRSFWYFDGTRSLLNSIWLQGGVAAVLTFLLANFGFLKARRPGDQNALRLTLFVFLVLLSMWAYNEALFDRLFALIVSFIIAWILVLPGSETPDEEDATAVEEPEGVPDYGIPAQ
jgi:hypothetical protein